MSLGRNITDEEFRAALELDHLAYYIANYEHVTNKKKYINFNADGYRFQEAIYLDGKKYIVIKKATQTGISEFLIIRSMSSLKRGRNIFFVIPKWELIRRFVKKRFNVSVKNTPYYLSGMDAVDKYDRQSINLKSLWGSTIAFVGSNSESGFAEFVADDVFIDELDHCFQDHLPMAEERQGDSEDPQSIKIANPSIPNYGISLLYADSDQKRFNTKGTHCNTWIIPRFLDHVVTKHEDDFLVLDQEWEEGKPVRALCHKCRKPFNPKADGEWVATYPSRDISGYHVTRMIGGRRDLNYQLNRFMDGLTNERVMERVYNADFGEEYTSAGAKVSFEMLDDCAHDYAMPSKLKEGVSVMGIDVGSQLHVRVSQILPDSQMRAVYIGTIPMMTGHKEIDVIKRLWNAYRCKAGVIDANPELRLARDVCTQIPGFFRWQHLESGKDRVDMKTKMVSFNRNLLLDDVKEMILLKNLILSNRTRQSAPLTPQGVSEYYANMTASTRMFIEATGKYKWVETLPDHYMFAEGYTLLARKMLLSIVGRGHAI